MIGSGIGGLQTIFEASIQVNEGRARRLSPFFIPSALINLVSGHVSIKYGLQGPEPFGRDRLRHRRACDRRCVAADHVGRCRRDGGRRRRSRRVRSGHRRLLRIPRVVHRASTTSRARASRPWDKDRDGFVMGEGAGVLVLEEYEHAKQRGAKIYAEIAGYGMSGDAFHITAPAEGHDGAVRSMRAAFRNGGIAPDQVQYVNAHGTSTPLGDDLELEAVEHVFGDAAKGLAMSSTKSATGHLLGRGRCGGGDLLHPRRARQRGAADAEPRRTEPGERDRSRGQDGPGAPDRRAPCPTASGLAALTHR